MSSPDVIRLRHMQEAVVATLEMAAGRKRSDLDEKLMLRMALTRSLEILGEVPQKWALKLEPLPPHPIRQNRQDLPALLSALESAVARLILDRSSATRTFCTCKEIQAATLVPPCLAAFLACKC